MSNRNLIIIGLCIILCGEIKSQNCDSILQSAKSRFENGMDSIQLIIESFNERKWQCEAIVLCKNKNTWSGEMCVSKTKNKGSKFIITNNYFVLKPSVNWETIIQKYFDLKFDQLPDMKDINEGEFKVLDGTNNIFTYRTGTVSRSVSYKSPGLFRKRSWQTKNAAEILKLHKKHFKKIKK
jgi:hypothetical protein